MKKALVFGFSLVLLGNGEWSEASSQNEEFSAVIKSELQEFAASGKGFSLGGVTIEKVDTYGGEFNKYHKVRYTAKLNYVEPVYRVHSFVGENAIFSKTADKGDSYNLEAEYFIYPDGPGWKAKSGGSPISIAFRGMTLSDLQDVFGRKYRSFVLLGTPKADTLIKGNESEYHINRHKWMSKWYLDSYYDFRDIVTAANSKNAPNSEVVFRGNVYDVYINKDDRYNQRARLGKSMPANIKGCTMHFNRIFQGGVSVSSDGGSDYLVKFSERKSTVRGVRKVVHACDYIYRNELAGELPHRSFSHEFVYFEK